MSEFLRQVPGLYNYWIVIFLMMTGFYIVIARTNLIQKVIGLNIFQISVFLLYITMGKVTGGTAPILPAHGVGHDDVAHVAAVENVDLHEGEPEASHSEVHSEEETRYTHPLPSVLMLTAIVVGVATTALALALIVRIGEAYGTIEEDEILLQDREAS